MRCTLHNARASAPHPTPQRSTPVPVDLSPRIIFYVPTDYSSHRSHIQLVYCGPPLHLSLHRLSLAPASPPLHRLYSVHTYICLSTDYILHTYICLSTDCILHTYMYICLSTDYISPPTTHTPADYILLSGDYRLGRLSSRGIIVRRPAAGQGGRRRQRRLAFVC